MECPRKVFSNGRMVPEVLHPHLQRMGGRGSVTVQALGRDGTMIMEWLGSSLSALPFSLSSLSFLPFHHSLSPLLLSSVNTLQTTLQTL
jgi:hypothetical protein